MVALCIGFSALVLFAPPAFAQLSVPALAPTALSLPLVIVWILSLLLGFVNYSVQSGSLLGQVTVPKPWLPWLTLLGTFLGGIVSYLTSQPTLTLNGPTVFFALVTGVLDLLTGAAPAVALHAMHVLPGQMRAVRAARLAAHKTAERAVDSVISSAGNASPTASDSIEVIADEKKPEEPKA
jgi:hypothetical protein